MDIVLMVLATHYGEPDVRGSYCLSSALRGPRSRTF